MDMIPDDGRRRVTGKEDLILSLDNSGLYLIKIAARVRDKKQLQGTRDEYLRIEIDGKKFPPDSPAVFAGGKLKGLKETIFFIISLKSGKHTVSLYADQGADLESFKISHFNIIEKAVKGERPVNENNVPFLSDRWHKIRYQDKDGFVFSMAVEIKGEDVDNIQNLIIGEARRLMIDSSLALGIARCESTLFPYQVSSAGAKGLFQITDTLVQDLNNKEKPFYSPVDNPFSIVQNITAGISYLKWLYNLYQNDQQRIEKTIIAYNAGPGAVPQGAVDLSSYEFQTKRLIQCVLGNGNEI